MVSKIYTHTIRGKKEDTFYLCVFRDFLLLIAVYVDSNRCPIATCPTESVDDSRTIREGYTQTLKLEQHSTVCVRQA